MNPWVKNPQAALNPGPYAEGDRVGFLWGVTPVEGVVVEDRGNLGVHGQRLYRIRADMGPDSPPLEITLAAEQLNLVVPAGRKNRNAAREE